MSSGSLIDKPSASQGVLDDLLNRITTGSLKAGDKLLPTDKLANHYDVAIPTAHRALKELVKLGYPELVQHLQAQ